MILFLCLAKVAKRDRVMPPNFFQKSSKFLPLSVQVCHLLLTILFTPRCGYSMKDIAERDSYQVVSIPRSTLYSLLKKLSQDQLIIDMTEKSHAQKSLHQHYYQMTPLGKFTLMRDLARQRNNLTSYQHYKKLMRLNKKSLYK